MIENDADGGCGSEGHSGTQEPFPEAPEAFCGALAHRTAAELAALEQYVLQRREEAYARAAALHGEVDRCQREYYRVHQARLKAAARERKEAK